MCCSYKTMRNLTIFFNVMFLLAGAGILAVGVWVIIDFGSWANLFAGSSSVLFQYAAFAMIGLGSFIVIVAFLGCCGAWKENGCLLVTFAIILIILLMAEVAVMVLAFVYYTQIDALLGTSALASLTSVYGSTGATGTTVTNAWDLAHATFSCCGYNNGTDWTGSVYDLSSTAAMPWPTSCCRTTSGAVVDQTQCLASSDSAYSYANTGCVTALKRMINLYTPLIGGISAGVMLIQILAVAFACKLNSKKNQVEAFA